MSRGLCCVLLSFWLVAIGFVSAPVRAIETGQPAVTALGIDTEGNAVLPAQLQGKVVLALYWTSWCGYCRKAIPDFMQFQQVAAQHGLQVVFINVKEDRDVFRNARRWSRDSGVLMAHDRKGTALAAYGGSSYPYILMLDRQGTVQSIRSGYGEKSKRYYIDALNALLTNKPMPEEPGGFTFEWKSSSDADASASDTTNNP